MSNNNNTNNINSINNHDDERRAQIVEDAPAFHSVAMMSGMSAPAFPLRSATSLMPSKQSLNIGLEPALRTKPDHGEVAAEGPAWKVEKALAIPSYHELERTHTYVANGSAAEVSGRIAQFLRNESIAATFDDHQVRHCVFLLSCDSR